MDGTAKSPPSCVRHGTWTGGQKRCPTCNRENLARWRAQNPERIREAQRAYKLANRERVAANARIRTQLIKAEVIDHYGGSCACCGESQLVFLTIDHPEGNGAAHRRAIFGDSVGRAGERFYRWLKRNGLPAEFRVLCWNCQHASFRGECPHEELRKEW